MVWPHAPSCSIVDSFKGQYVTWWRGERPTTTARNITLATIGPLDIGAAGNGFTFAISRIVLSWVCKGLEIKLSPVKGVFTRCLKDSVFQSEFRCYSCISVKRKSFKQRKDTWSSIRPLNRIKETISYTWYNPKFHITQTTRRSHKSQIWGGGQTEQAVIISLTKVAGGYIER
jgi:hypothetical protein